VGFSLSGYRIIVAEDERFIRSVIVRSLRTLGGPTIEEVTNGVDALAALGAPGASFDFALVDFNMPALSGLEFLKEVRCGRSKARRDLPIALLTGHSDRNLVVAAMALDVNAFVLKPVSQQTLATRLQRMLADGSEIQDVSVYAAVETTGLVPMDVAQKNLPPSVILPAPERPRVGVAPPRASRELNSPELSRMRMKVPSLCVGQIVAQDIISPLGTRLLSAGVTLNNRLLSRLKDLADMNEIDHVWVQSSSMTA